MTRDALRHSTAGAVVVSILLYAGLAWSVPPSIQHQGRLLKDNGEPMSGQKTLKFTIYDQKTNGSIIWQSPEKAVSLGENGFYSVTLGGQANAIDASKLDGQNLWIGLSVDGTELSPRIPIKSVPYAVRSGEADAVADGAVGTNALQNNSISSNKISGVDWNKVQNKPETLGGLSCANGQSAVYQNGQWTCGSSGSPLSGQSCGTGQVVKGVNGSGNLSCVSDSDTTYNAGSGLNLSGNSFELADKSCSGAVSGVQNGRLQCTSVGDIDGVSAGTGLNGGGSSGNVTLDVDYNDVQQRVSDSCSSGEFMTGINQNGTVNCSKPSGSSTSCSNKSFKEANVCPVGSNDMSGDCDDVPVGSFCEYDTGCSLNSSLDNCGIYDYYLRTD